MKIFTSIAPRGIEKQQHAVRSWAEHGFEPHSLNTGDEIFLLRTRFPEVRFIEVERNAMDTIGKPFVFVDDLLSACRNSGDPVSGIVNSDIFFRAPVDLPALFAEHAANGIVYGSRVDLESCEARTGQVYEVGFDFFFMDRDTAGLYPRTKLCMGAPMWDYWAPLIPILRGRPCRFLNAMVAFHVVHEQAWDNEINIRMMHEIIQYSGIEFEGIDGVDFTTHNHASGRVLHEFAQFITPFLAQNSEPVFRTAQPA